MDIKFRAWNNDYKEMIILENSGLQYFDFEGNYSLGFTVDGYSGFWGHEQYDSASEKASRFPLMLFTGLKDKNKKDIYQGDIVKGNHKDNFLIELINGGLQMYNTNYFGQDHNELISTATCEPQTRRWLENSEVIGNIYENHDLLENN